MASVGLVTHLSVRRDRCEGHIPQIDPAERFHAVLRDVGGKGRRAMSRTSPDLRRKSRRCIEPPVASIPNLGGSTMQR
jgi:hypothetical protein